MSDKRACRTNINYKTFSDMGDRVLKEDPIVSVGISCKPKMEDLFMAKSEIDDYFSENPILGISDVDDLKSCLSIIREVRVKFKKSMFEVKSDMGEDKFVAMCPFCKEHLDQASDYITQANERVTGLGEGEAKKADDLAEKIRLAEIAEKQRLEKKADDLAEKIRLEEITRAEKIRLAEIAEKQREVMKADDLAEKIRLAEIAEKQRLEKKADDLAEKIRLADIAEKQRLEDKADEREKKADDLAEKIRLKEITRAEKSRNEDLELAEKVRKKLEEKEDAEKVAAA